MLAWQVGGNDHSLAAQTDDIHILAGMVVSMHASSYAQTNRVRVDVKDFPWSRLSVEDALRPRDFGFECMTPGCKGANTFRADHHMPLFMLPAMCITFHTLHEGHGIKIYVDDELVHPLSPLPEASQRP